MDDHSAVTFGTRFLSDLIGPCKLWSFLAVAAGIPAAGLSETPHRFHVTVLALAPWEGRAVIQMPSGSLTTVVPGDVLTEIRVRVVGILNDKLVLETTAAEGVPAFPRRVWVYQATKIGEPSQTHELKQALPRRPPIRRPVSHSVDVEGFQGRSLPD